MPELEGVCRAGAADTAEFPNPEVFCSRRDTTSQRERAAAIDLVVDLVHVVLNLLSGCVLAGFLLRLNHLDVIQVDRGEMVSLDCPIVRGERVTNPF